ncbi:hypothetical protein BU14_0494s0002 [Porphyra umbilicalis]|uniref:Uncharacterized protein n=1 Tax=Porphyra umbilicalis TaxID=2786 RepID=A0A1X6NTC2_PORUM|nr:hypothetical protein BU14_0494s0002 [Porphyra umbilicalis]|eukprot:OSX71848.1 hypothetical protein BU14_0494s0002 [Porphyra umbilicalis]
MNHTGARHARAHASTPPPHPPPALFVSQRSCLPPHRRQNGIVHRVIHDPPVQPERHITRVRVAQQARQAVAVPAARRAPAEHVCHGRRRRHRVGKKVAGPKRKRRLGHVPVDARRRDGRVVPHDAVGDGGSVGARRGGGERHHPRERNRARGGGVEHLLVEALPERRGEHRRHIPHVRQAGEGVGDARDGQPPPVADAVKQPVAVRAVLKAGAEDVGRPKGGREGAAVAQRRLHVDRRARRVVAGHVRRERPIVRVRAGRGDVKDFGARGARGERRRRVGHRLGRIVIDGVDAGGRRLGRRAGRQGKGRRVRHRQRRVPVIGLLVGGGGADLVHVDRVPSVEERLGEVRANDRVAPRRRVDD